MVTICHICMLLVDRCRRWGWISLFPRIFKLFLYSIVHSLVDFLFQWPLILLNFLRTHEDVWIFLSLVWTYETFLYLFSVCFPCELTARNLVVILRLLVFVSDLKKFIAEKLITFSKLLNCLQFFLKYMHTLAQLSKFT